MAQRKPLDWKEPDAGCARDVITGLDLLFKHHQEFDLDCLVRINATFDIRGRELKLTRWRETTVDGINGCPVWEREAYLVAGCATWLARHARHAEMVIGRAAVLVDVEKGGAFVVKRPEGTAHEVLAEIADYEQRRH